MENEKKWFIYKYSKWDSNGWTEIPCEKSKCCILFSGSQIIILNKDVALESLNLIEGNGIVKCFYANDSIGIISNTQQHIMTKFKICLDDSPGKTKFQNCLEVVEYMKNFVTVTEHPTHKGIKAKEDISVKTVTELLKELLEDKNLFKSMDFVLPEESIAELMQQCLLDTGFPPLVGKVENLVKSNSIV